MGERVGAMQATDYKRGRYAAVLADSALAAVLRVFSCASAARISVRLLLDLIGEDVLRRALMLERNLRRHLARRCAGRATPP